MYNESFPLDSKYADVSKRLNDKFSDTVSFKYLCPGDDIDPDNLVQVQGDDDLQVRTHGGSPLTSRRQRLGRYNRPESAILQPANRIEQCAFHLWGWDSRSGLPDVLIA